MECLEDFQKLPEDNQNEILEDLKVVLIDHNLASYNKNGFDVSNYFSKLKPEVIQLGISISRENQREYIKDEHYFGKTNLSGLKDFLNSL